MLHFKFSLFTSSAMASSSTHRVSDVPDANLLDEDDFEFELDQAECAALNAQTPRAGKKIRMNSPPPRSPASSSTGPESPSRTPPRDLGTNQNRTDKHETFKHKHVCRFKRLQRHITTMQWIIQRAQNWQIISKDIYMYIT